VGATWACDQMASRETVGVTSEEPIELNLPVTPPFDPMLAKLSRAIPDGDGWRFEPKWDGFRCIVFRDGDQIVLLSRNNRPLNRYFPELLEALPDALGPRVVVDGEIVLPDPHGHGLDFDALQQRIHPAESRVRRLAAETPTAFVAFDLLAIGDDSLLDRPYDERRQLLESHVSTTASVHLTPVTSDRDQATTWFERFEGAGLDGIVAKRGDEPYVPGKRTLVKVKHERTADCVVAGYRVHKDGNGVGSLLLGLFDETGRLHHVGVAASFPVTQRSELLAEMQPLTVDALVDHPWRDWAEAQAHEDGRMPGGISRWTGNKDMSWVPVRCERVLEVTFGQLESGRFRHGVKFVRWRPDRDPSSCTYEQLDVAAPVAFSSLFS
jgi:ATP-dependent DNA ligase